MDECILIIVRSPCGRVYVMGAARGKCRLYLVKGSMRELHG